MSGDKGTRTPDLVSAIDALSQLSYIPVFGFRTSVDTRGLLSSVQTRRSPKLSYVPQVGLARLELATSRLSGVRSNQLSYSPKSNRVEL